jgi:hypothetical protein
MVLVILEPLVTFVLAALALLGLLTTLFFYLVGPPEFPVWTMLALSLGFAIALLPYYALIKLLSFDEPSAPVFYWRKAGKEGSQWLPNCELWSSLRGV